MDLIVQAVVRGSLYALVALGFAAVFGAARIVNLAHGSFYLLGAYGTYVTYRALGVLLPPAWSVSVATVLASVAVGAFGAAYYAAVLKPAARSPDTAMVLCMATNILVGALVQLAAGSRSTMVPPIVSGSIGVGGALVLRQELLVLPAVAVLFPVMGLVIYRTRFGRAVRALGQNREAALLAGIHEDRVLIGVFALSSAFAALAGGLVSPIRVLSSGMWLPALLKSFGIVILGGVGSLRGTLAAAYLLGFAEVATTQLWRDSASEYVALAAVIAVLAVRPRGLLGKGED